MSQKDKWTNENDTRFTMRIDSTLLEIIKKSAMINKRSTAKEIIYVLEKYYNSSNKGSEDETEYIPR